MPLIPCPACSKPISVKAISCPQCGHPLAAAAAGDTRQAEHCRRRGTPRSEAIATTVLIGGAIALGWLMLRAKSADHEPTGTPAPVVDPVPAPALRAPAISELAVGRRAELQRFVVDSPAGVEVSLIGEGDHVLLVRLEGRPSDDLVAHAARILQSVTGFGSSRCNELVFDAQREQRRNKHSRGVDIGSAYIVEQELRVTSSGGSRPGVVQVELTRD